MKKLFPVLMVLMLGGLTAVTTFAQSTSPINEMAPKPLDDHEQAEVAWAARPIPEDTGGPDLFGYTYADSNEAICTPTFNDISGLNPDLGLNSDDEILLTMPFDFTFYGETSRDLLLGNKGAIVFARSVPGQVFFLNSELPYNNSTFGAGIFPFWDDLDDSNVIGGGVFTATVGTAPNRQYIIQWEEIPHFENIGLATFQVVFHETSNQINFVYDDVEFNNSQYDFGQSATIGIQQDPDDGLSFLQYSFNEPSLVGRTAVCFFAPVEGPNLNASYKIAPPANIKTDPLTYTIVISNGSLYTATNTTISDTIPAGTSYINNSLTCMGGDGTCSFSGDGVLWQGEIDPYEQITMTFAVDASNNTCATPILNTAVVRNPTAVSPQLFLNSETIVYDGAIVQAFEADNGGFSGSFDWQWGQPTYPVGLNAHSGQNVWATNLNAPYTNLGNFNVLTRTFDLDAYGPGSTLGWWQYLKSGGSLFDFANVVVNGDVPYTTLERGFDDLDWTYYNVPLDAYAGNGEVGIGFYFFASTIVEDDGWYLDDVTIWTCPPPPLEIELEKTVGTNPAECATTDDITVYDGTEVTYCYSVTNQGTTTLTLHTLEDDGLGTLFTDFPYELGYRESMFVTQTAVINTTNTDSATWTGYNVGPTNTISATDNTRVRIGIDEPLTPNGNPVQFEFGIPLDWQVIDNAGNGVQWTVTSEPQCQFGNNTGGTGLAACMDTIFGGPPAIAYDAELVSPPFSLIGFDAAALNASIFYRDLNTGSNDRFYIDIIHNGGRTNMLTWDEDHDTPYEDVVINLNQFAGQNNLQVAFRYAGNGYDHYAQIDDIRLIALLGGTPQIEISKTVGTQATGCAPNSNLTLQPNTPVYYCLTITNTGDITFTNHLVTDNLLGVDINLPYTLPPNASVNITNDTLVSFGFDALFGPLTVTQNITNVIEVLATDGVYETSEIATATVQTAKPNMVINPTGITTSGTLPLTQSIIISNTGEADLFWQAQESEARPESFGDELFRLPNIEATTGSVILLGVETIAQEYWITSAGDSVTSDPNKLFHLDAQGNLIASYTQPTSSEWGWRDLAYDGTYLYGSDSDVLDQIDPTTGDVTDVTIPCPSNPCRALAFDPATGHFWTKDFSNDLYEFDREGNIINQYALDLSTYGAAWDGVSEDGPFLWLWTQEGDDESEQVLGYQFDPIAGELTGVTLQGSILVSSGLNNIAGGATISTDIVENRVTFVTLHQSQQDSNTGNQGDTIVGYELGTTCNPTDVDWLTVSPTAGTVMTHTSQLMQIGTDPTGYATGSYTANVCLTSNDPEQQTLNIPVEMVIETAVPTLSLNATLSTNGSCGTTGSVTVVSETAVTICYTATNTGNTLLNTHLITDSAWGALDPISYVLAPNTSISITRTVTPLVGETSFVTWWATDGTNETQANDSYTITIGSNQIYLPIIRRFQ